MLQVTFKNLLPSEELVGAANDVYLSLHHGAKIGSPRLRCSVTISAEQRAAESAPWVSVQVEVVPGRGQARRAVAAGANPRLVIRSGMLAAAPTHTHSPQLPFREAAC